VWIIAKVLVESVLIEVLLLKEEEYMGVTGRLGGSFNYLQLISTIIWVFKKQSRSVGCIEHLRKSKYSTI